MEFQLKAMKILEEKLGINNIITAKSYNNIGGIYLREKKYDISMEYY